MAHAEQLDEIEALQAIYDEVEVLCDDEGQVALVVHVHPELDRVQVRFEGRLEADASRPALERTVSGGHVASLQHLPPLRLQVSFPADYLEVPESAPSFEVASCWLDGDLLSGLCGSLDQRWQEMEGSPIVVTWAETLRSEVVEVVERGGGIQLRTSTGALDARAKPECQDPMQTMLELLLYDKCRGLDLWKQQQHLCQICFCEYPGSQFVHLGQCVHAFCKSCVAAMAELHVTEGSLSELRCPEPSCRADIAQAALQEVLDAEKLERFCMLKLQRVAAELKGVVFCPRCEESGRETAVMPEQEDELSVARCLTCEYVFCGKCLGLYHGREPCLHPEERAQQAAMRRLGDAQGQAEKRRLKREAERGYLVCVEAGAELPLIDAAGYATEDSEPILQGDYVAAVHQGVPERITGSTLWEAKRDSVCVLSEVLRDAPR